MKVVLDSNVLLSALGTHGLCTDLLEACLLNHTLFSSTPLIDEVETHLSAKFKMPQARIKEIVDFLTAEFEIVAPVPVRKDACRDPKDLMVLGTAVAAQADVIVSGDKDLLVVGRHEGIPIVSPRDLYERLK